MTTGFNEYTRAAAWLTATLSTPPITGVSGVYEHPAPQGAVFPLITFSQQSEIDLEVINANRVWADFIFVVRVIGQTASSLSLQAIADEIDKRLHRTNGVTVDSQVISSVRLSVFHQSEEFQGLEYRHSGGLYELLVQPLSP
jgi:hypothetical protein